MDRERVWIDKQTPGAQKALIAVASEARAAGTAAGLDRRVIELINMRVSQINGCPSCLDTHHRAAVAAGVTEQELAVLPAWRHGGPFGARERAVLALAEITTALPDEPTLAREYAEARGQLSDEQVSAVVWIATVIGAFNRVSIMSGHPVRVRKENAVADQAPAAGESPENTAQENKVVNNPERHRYEVFHGGQQAGFTEYVERDDVTDFVHTEINDRFAGKGLGKVLAAGALDDVVARGRVIEARCPFIRTYLDKHPEYDPHVLGKGIKR